MCDVVAVLPTFDITKPAKTIVQSDNGILIFYFLDIVRSSFAIPVPLNKTDDSIVSQIISAYLKCSSWAITMEIFITRVEF
jgi:hypothetical protein